MKLHSRRTTSPTAKEFGVATGMRRVGPVRSAVNNTAEPVVVHTDSQYVRQGITEWLPQWHARAWKTANRKPVKNQDLWQELDALTQRHAIEWHWVKGHAGHPENERADALANRGIDELT